MMSNKSGLFLKANSIADDLIEDCRAADFSGYDPFDALNSTLFARCRGTRSSWARISWLQLFKRSPVNLRKFTGVPKMRNPKGIALIILGLIARHERDYANSELGEAIALGDWLLNERVDQSVWKHYAWGYHFDWAARAFYVPRGKPNAITTCYVARALYALGEATNLTRFIDAAVDAGYFLDTLHTRMSELEYYAYIPGEVALVHNASLWAAALVAKTAVHACDEPMLQRALRVAHQSVSMQRHDGAWLYGTRAHHGFIDGFHTGYNLEALDLLQRTVVTSEFTEAIQNGLRYYRDNFFLPDGTVKYYDNCTWPLDMHSVAQAIITLTKIGTTDQDFSLADAVVSRACSLLYLPKTGRFVYQRWRWWTNRINYLRWTQAWAFYALSVYAGSNFDLEVGNGPD